MSTLVAIAYPDRATAEQVRQELIQAMKEHLVRLEDAVDFGSKLSIQDAATQAKAALQQLADSYRSTFGQLDCS